jgi:ABC-type cobalamin/Fe3+-siderophores transport system ATPase subunit
MKISHINIPNFQQFKDFRLDLTYPKGHAKAGQPLDKVCLIGQSGTGKTTILNQLYNVLLHFFYGTQAELYTATPPNNFNFSIKASFDKMRSVEVFIANKEVLIYDPHDDFEVDLPTFFSSLVEQGYYDKHHNKLVNFPAETIDSINNILQNQVVENPLRNIRTSDNMKEKIIAEREKLATKTVYNFATDNPLELWKSILLDLQEYEDARNYYSRQISEALLENDDMPIENLRDQFRQWKKNNPNPLEDLGNLLNPILNQFQLEVNTKAEYKFSEEVKFIQVNTLAGDNVPYSKWSTGTKQIILTATPLFKLNMRNTVVLMDEPERSLYPNMQSMAIDYYTRLAPQAQFLFATHSPLIAASFDPWEVVELQFNEAGHVERKLYYEGENHVDNYMPHPKTLRWDEILQQLFGLTAESYQTGEESLQRASALKVKLKQWMENKQMETPEATAALKEFEQLSQQLAWQVMNI